MKICSAILVILLSSGNLLAQEDLMDLVDKETDPPETFTEQIFKGTRLINGHSVETRDGGVLDVIISHRFGRVNTGAYALFGLDESNVRLGVDYGISDRLNAGAGRNSFEKTFDGFLKYKFLRQREGQGAMPMSVVGFSSVALKTLRTGNPEGEPSLSSRLAYTFQLIIARKFSPSFSFQISPTLVHRNTVPALSDPNDLIALGGGGRVKLTKRLSLNGEYYHLLNPGPNSTAQNALAIGFDIETGGHVFQLHFTNARAMNEKGFITETDGDFFDGDIHFGFNISRVFQLRE